MNDRNRAGEVQIAWQLLTDAMLMETAVHPVNKLVNARGKIGVPANAGVYAFWWVGDRDQLMQANREIVLRGPGGKQVKVEYHDWWPSDAPYPCLYGGKATNLKKRVGQHLMRGTAGRAHEALSDNAKAKPRTTACQLRFGIEHVFRTHANPLALIDDCDNAVAERFFAEDRLVGHLRRWFNIDSEP